METNQIIFVFISLSCLFSLSASRPGISPASAPFSSDIQTFSYSETEGNDNSATFSILPNSADPGLQKICGNTDHPIECVQTTAPFLRENAVVDPLSVLEVGLEALGNKTKEALAQATRLLLDPTVQEAVASSLETCVDGYNAILDGNEKILDAISMRDTYQLNMELSSNVENVHACSEAFEEAELVSPIKEIDSLLVKMVSNSLAIGVDMVRF